MGEKGWIVYKGYVDGWVRAFVDNQFTYTEYATTAHVFKSEAAAEAIAFLCNGIVDTEG